MLRWRYLKMSFLWWFGLAWALVGTTLFFVGAGMWSAEREFTAAAITGTATIVEKGHDTDKDGDSNYWMRFVFHDASGAEHVGVRRVSWEIWRSFNDGDTVEIRYLPADPNVARLAVQEQDGTYLAFLLLGIAFGGIGWVLLGRAFVVNSRRAALVQSGLAALGKVTSVDINRNVKINKRNPLYLMYEFLDETGTAHHGRSIDLPHRLENRWNPGDAVLVVYDPMKPDHHEIDIFDVRANEADLLARRSRTIEG